MGNFEILSENLITTTTVIGVGANTSTVGNLLDRNPNTFYEGQTTSNSNLQATFSAGITLNRIIITGVNASQFAVIYDNDQTTGSYLAITDANTTSSYWINNTEENHYLKFTTLTSVTRINVQLQTTTATVPKKASQLCLANRKFVLTDNPSSSQYQAKLKRAMASNQMANGGDQLTIFGEAYESKIRLTYQGDSMRDNLKSLYDEKASFNIVPYPTGTSWEGNEFYLVNWAGDFNKQPAKNDIVTNGWNIDMNLKEVAK